MPSGRMSNSIRCDLLWGARCAAMAAGRGDIVVIVDVLSFSTSLAVAVHRGAFIYPCERPEQAASAARHVNAEIAVRRAEVPSKGRFSLSPSTFETIESGDRVVLPSPNGARCTVEAQGSPAVCAGAIVNAAAVAEFVTKTARESVRGISIIACGEVVKPYVSDSPIRYALEDFIGAGAIASDLQYDKSLEVQAAEAVFRAAEANLKQALNDCESGQELLTIGYHRDLFLAARLNSVSAVPIFDGEQYLGAVRV